MKNKPYFIGDTAVIKDNNSGHQFKIGERVKINICFSNTAHRYEYVAESIKTYEIWNVIQKDLKPDIKSILQSL